VVEGDKPMTARQTIAATSHLMVEFMNLVEKHMGRRLTPEEARVLPKDAREYAKTMLKWIKKGNLKGDNHDKER
jgi:hypothetical protein